MSEANNKLFDIESKLSARFDPKKRVIMFDSRYYDVRHHIVNQKLSKYSSGDCISIAGLEVSPGRVLQSLLQNHDAVSDSSHKASTYGQLCEQLEVQKRGVIHVYEIHKLSRESIHLLSQIIRYGKKHDLNWRIVLTGNMSWVDRKRLLPLNIDYLYAPKELVYENGSESNLVPQTFSTNPLLGMSGLKPSSILIALGVIAAIGLMFIKVDNSSPEISKQLNLPTQTNIGSDDPEASYTDAENDAYLAMLERKERSFNAQLKEFTESKLSSEQESIATSTPTKVRPQSEPLLAKKKTRPAGSNHPKSKGIQKQQRFRMSENVVAALKQFDMNRVTALYNQGEPINGLDDQGQTALTYAVLNNHPQLASYLIKAGASLDIKDVQGHTALFYAAVIGNAAAVNQLLKNGAQVNATSNLLKTPLMAAAHNDHTQIVSSLLKAGANVNQHDHSGWTPLFFATWNNNVQLVKQLVEAGANKMHKDKDGYTVNEIAQLKGNQLLAQVLAD